MEGSPVRGQEKARIARLNKSHDIQNFQAELVRWAGGELEHAQVFFGLHDVTSETVQLPSWVKSHLERHPGLYLKLVQGEMVGISHLEENPGVRPVAAARSSVVLIPVMSDGMLQAAIGLVSPFDGPQLSVEDIETVRQFAHECAPILTRLQEIEKLRRENQELKMRAERAIDAEQEFAEVVEAKNALEAVIQMRSHLQANVAHELRTPLAAIRGYARMILDGRGGEINDTQRDYLRIVTENTNRLINVVSWMSYVADLSAQHFKLSTFDLREVWRECVKANEQTLSEKSLQLVQQIPDEPFTMMGDRDKIAYVFNELISAAVKFSETAATIAAEFSHGREKEMTVKISEKGSGIPPGTLNKIFERSFNTISKPVTPSTDAGATNLSGVYDVVGMHGGRVFVNSTAGQGTTFLFTLPTVIVGAEENSHEQAVNSGRRRR